MQLGCGKAFLILSTLAIALIDAGKLLDRQRRNNSKHISRIACEGQVMDLTCPEGQLIHVVRANYGRFSLNVCNNAGTYWANTQCAYSKTHRVMAERCENRNSCSVVSNQSILDVDPCPDTEKYLDVAYNCQVAGEQTTTIVTVADDVEDIDNDIVTLPYTKPTETTTVRNSPAEVSVFDPETTTVEEIIDIPHVSTVTICEATVIRGIRWPETFVGKSAKQPCPNSDHIRSEYAEWFCGFDGNWMNDHPDLSRCVSQWSKNIQTTVVEVRTVEVLLTTAAQLREASRRETFYGGDTIMATSLLNTMVETGVAQIRSLPSAEKKFEAATKLAEDIVYTGHYLLDEQRNSGWKDLGVVNQTRSANAILNSVEMNGFLVAETLVSNRPFHSYRDNIDLEVSLVSSRLSSVRFPSKSFYDPNVDYVQIPEVALKTGANGAERAQVVFASFKHIGEYMKPSDYVSGDDIVRRFVASRVISASVNNQRGIWNLPEPVYITMQTQAGPNVSNPQCVFWDTRIGDENQVGFWSTEGCERVSSNDTHTVCACNHLTNFAVLMDFRGIQLPFYHEFSLVLVTYVGCIVSIVCLLFSIVAFQLFIGLHGERVTIHKNLCFCLMVAELIFLCGISQTENRVVCGVVAGLLHYFFLATFTWMLLEGFQLYALLVEVFEAENSRKKWFYLFGYGIPLVIVGISVAIDYNSYGTPDRCWLNTANYFVFSFVGPVSVVLVANFLFLIMAMVVMCRHAHVSAAYRHKKQQSTGENIKQWVKGAFVLVILLGLTWSLGFLYINQSTVTFAYAFAICNSLQGVFIFLFHVVFNDKMRSEYRKWARKSDCLPDCLRPAAKTYDIDRAAEIERLQTNSSQSSPPYSNTTSSTNPSSLAKLFRLNDWRKGSSAQLLLAKSPISSAKMGVMVDAGPKYFYHPGSVLYGADKSYITAYPQEFDSGIGDSNGSSISFTPVDQQQLYHVVNIEELQYQRHGPPSFPPPKVPHYAMYQCKEDLYDPDLSTFECSQFDSEVNGDPTRMFQVAKPFDYGSFVPPPVNRQSQLPSVHKGDLMDSCDYLLPNERVKVGLKVDNGNKISSPVSEGHLACESESDGTQAGSYIPCKSLPNLQRRQECHCGKEVEEAQSKGSSQPQSSLPSVLIRPTQPRMGVYPLYSSEHSMAVGYADGSTGYSQSRPKTLMKKSSRQPFEPQL